MSIVRIEHNKSNPYVVLNKQALEDKNLSWGAKGLWAYLMSRPDNWHVSVNHLSKIYVGRGGKKDAIYALLAELIDNGYCRREQQKNDKGQYEAAEYIITEFKNKVPNRDNPEPDKPDSAKADSTKYRDILSKEEKISTESSSSIDSDDPDDACGADDDREYEKIFYRDTKGQVKTLTQTEVYQHFLKKPYSTKTVKEAIQRFRDICNPVNNALKYIETICETVDRGNDKKPVKTPKNPVNQERKPKIKEETITFGDYVEKCRKK